MPHIISNRKRLCFVHIPKNGGTTIRDQIVRFDDTGLRYGFGDPVPSEQGPVQLGHAPLRIIDELFPEDIGTLAAYRSYAILRDPTARFFSALAQRARGVLKTSLQDMSSTERRREIDIVIDHVTARPDLPDPVFCHFIRQTDFVFLDGRQIVGNLYPIEKLDLLFADISAHLGAALDPGHYNRTEISRFGATGHTARKIWQTIQPWMPGAAAGLGRALRPLFLTELKGNTFPEAQDADLRAFLRTHYADDIALYEKTRAAFG